MRTLLFLSLTAIPVQLCLGASERRIKVPGATFELAQSWRITHHEEEEKEKGFPAFGSIELKKNKQRLTVASYLFDESTNQRSIFSIVPVELDRPGSKQCTLQNGMRCIRFFGRFTSKGSERIVRRVTIFSSRREIQVSASIPARDSSARKAVAAALMQIERSLQPDP